MKERGAGRTEPQVLWHEEKGSLTLEGSRCWNIPCPGRRSKTPA